MCTPTQKPFAEFTDSRRTRQMLSVFRLLVNMLTSTPEVPSFKLLISTDAQPVLQTQHSPPSETSIAGWVRTIKRNIWFSNVLWRDLQPHPQKFEALRNISLEQFLNRMVAGGQALSSQLRLFSFRPMVKLKASICPGWNALLFRCWKSAPSDNHMTFSQSRRHKARRDPSVILPEGRLVITCSEVSSTDVGFLMRLSVWLG
jgi:hypothetical protein